MGENRKTNVGKKSNGFKLAVQIIFISLIVIAAIGIRLAIAGGDWGCFFSEDPALCQTVKGLGG